MFALFVPAILNGLIGWTLWGWLFTRIGDYQETTAVFQNYVAWYVPFLLLLLVGFYWKRLPEAWRKRGKLFCPSRNGLLSDVLVSLLISGLVVTITLVLLKFSGGFTIAESLSETQWWAHFIGMVVVAPLTEEIIFRAYGFRVATERGWATGKGFIITALAFALWHANPFLILPAFLMGLVLYWLFVRTQTLFAPVLVHGIANGALFVIIYQ